MRKRVWPTVGGSAGRSVGRFVGRLVGGLVTLSLVNQSRIDMCPSIQVFLPPSYSFLFLPLPQKAARFQCKTISFFFYFVSSFPAFSFSLRLTFTRLSQRERLSGAAGTSHLITLPREFCQFCARVALFCDAFQVSNPLLPFLSFLPTFLSSLSQR